MYSLRSVLVFVLLGPILATYVVWPQPDAVLIALLLFYVVWGMGMVPALVAWSVGFALSHMVRLTVQRFAAHALIRGDNGSPFAARLRSLPLQVLLGSAIGAIAGAAIIPITPELHSTSLDAMYPWAARMLLTIFPGAVCGLVSALWAAPNNPLRWLLRLIKTS